MARLDDSMWRLSDVLRSMVGQGSKGGRIVATHIKTDPDGTGWFSVAGNPEPVPVQTNGVAYEEGDEVTLDTSGPTPVVSGSVTDPPIGRRRAERLMQPVRQLAKDAKEIAEATGQFFWADENGAHVSTEEGNPTGPQNTLWNSLGMLFRKGTNIVLAIVTGSSAGMDVYDGEGNQDGNVIASYRGGWSRIGYPDDMHLEMTGKALAFTDGEITEPGGSTYISGNAPFSVNLEGSYTDPFDHSGPVAVGPVLEVAGLTITDSWLQFKSSIGRPFMTIAEGRLGASELLFGRPYRSGASDNGATLHIDNDSVTMANEHGNDVFSVTPDGIKASDVDGTKVFEVNSNADTGNAFFVTEAEGTVSWESSQETTTSLTFEVASGHQITDSQPIIVYFDYTAEVRREGYAGEDSIEFLGYGNPEQFTFSLPYPPDPPSTQTYSSGVTFAYDGDHTITVESAPYDQSDAMDECELRIKRVECLVDDAYMPSLTYGTRSGDLHGFDAAIGEGIQTKHHHQVAIGRYNEANDTDLFQIGWGSSLNRGNVFAVTAGGDVRAEGRVFGRSARLLWTGALHMGANDVATLAAHPDDQPNGILLAWSAYSGGQAQNYQWHFDYIPKAWISMHNGNGVTCMMAGGLFNPMGCKYVYVSEDVNASSTITGHAGNNQSGTANGITYDNSKFVLREVWGV